MGSRTRSSRAIKGFASTLVMLLALTTACTPEQGAFSSAATATPGPSLAAKLECEQEEVPPQITEIQPAQVVPGSEISVIASGGITRDSCGSVFEGARDFKLYLDNEPVGKLSCYINRCVEQFTLPSSISAGSHCLSVQTDECQFEFQVTTD